ncbi:MAG: DinB family protein [Fimbriimonadales bacterium]
MNESPLAAAVLDSWDRQCRIVTAVANRVDETNRNAKPSPDGMPLYQQLAHIHKVRHYFLTNVAPERVAQIESSYANGWESPIEDLEKITRLLSESGAAVRDVVQNALSKGVDKLGWYDNAVMFLQHMVWHEGWHVGLIILGLRLAGQEAPEEWEEQHVWKEWCSVG